MKRICVFVLIVLAPIMQINAQVANDTIVAVQDTTNKLANEQDSEFTVKSAEGNEKQKRNKKRKSDDKNDCKECESQLVKTEKENTKLKKQVDGLITKLGNTNAIMEIDDRDFYRSLITTPLAKKYDSIQVDYYKKTAVLFDYDNKKEMKWVYEVYFPLLDNYGKYNKDLAILIQKVIRSFELLVAPDSKTEKELFNEGLEETEYYKKYRYKSNISQEIKYLEDVIKDTKLLFDNPSKFKKEYFDEQLRRLE